MPRKKKKRQEQLPFGDRVVTAFLGAILGFGTGLVFWLFVLYVLARTRQLDVHPPFWPVLAFSGLTALVGLLLGPERMMDMFEKLWGPRDE